MPKFKDRDEFLDNLWDHVFPNEDDEDPEWFDHLVKFFEDAPDNSGGGDNGGNNPPRRRRAGSSNSNAGSNRSGGQSRRRSRAGSGYNATWFGS